MYDYRQQTRVKLFVWIVLMVILICIAGFRYKMGTDSIKYENYYHWQHTLSQFRAYDFKDTRFAPLYVIVTTICRSITYDFMLVQFVVAIMVNCSIFYFFWKNSKHIFFAALLYYITMYTTFNMEVLREALAVSVFLWAWPCFKKGKWLKYYLYCLVAFLFHISALVMFLLPVFYLPWLRWFFTFGARTWIICIGVLTLSFVMQLFFFDFIQMLAITENIAERAQVYSKTELSGATLNLLGVVTQLIKYMVYPLLALYFINKNFGHNRQEKQEFQPQEFMTLMAIYVALLAVGITIFLRYRNYFHIFAILTMSDWIFTTIRFGGKSVRLKLVYWVLLFAPLIGLQITYYWSDFNKSGSIKNYMMYYPYSNRFDEKIDPQRQRAISYSRNL